MCGGGGADVHGFVKCNSILVGKRYNWSGQGENTFLLSRRNSYRKKRRKFMTLHVSLTACFRHSVYNHIMLRASDD